MLRELALWIDDEPRDGFDNMAIDEWLLETVVRPVLRIYRWQPGWGSYGYFIGNADAARALPGLKRVRRRTGGGIVDHRADWTYTLVVPSGEPLAAARGGESYRVIHGALAAALRDGGGAVRLAPDLGPVRGGECFVRPVEFDLLDEGGRKVAGAGQRRTGGALLHQGSVAIAADPDLGVRLAARLSERGSDFPRRPDAGAIEARAWRYRDPAWTARR